MYAGSMLLSVTRSRNTLNLVWTCSSWGPLLMWGHIPGAPEYSRSPPVGHILRVNTLYSESIPATLLLTYEKSIFLLVIRFWKTPNLTLNVLGTCSWWGSLLMWVRSPGNQAYSHNPPV